jgi:hypothetical protein
MSYPVVVPATRQAALPIWLGPVVTVFILQLAVMAAYVARFGGDISSLVCVREDVAGRFPYEHVHTSLSKEGFDGQYYYAIARDPWARQDERYVAPAGYRHMRILYPALAWVASNRGDPKLLLWALPAINLLAIGGLAGLGAIFAVRFGRSPWWGLMLPLVLNAGTPALRDLTDPVAMLAAFGVLCACLLRAGAGMVTLCALAAAFSREQNVAIVGIVLIAAIWRRNWSLAAGLFVSLTAWSAWVVFLRHTYGAWPLEPGNLDMPLAGIRYRFAHFQGDQVTRGAPIHAAGLLFIAAQVLLCLLIPWLRAPKTIALTGLVGAALALCGSAAIYMDGHSYTRVFVFMPLAVWLLTVHSGRSWPVLILSPAALWPLFALFQAWRR